MKIATYNLHFGGKGRTHWTEILCEYHADILLVQESYAPSEHLNPETYGSSHERAIWTPVEKNGKSLAWGSGVYFDGGVPTLLELPDFGGWVVGAERPSEVGVEGAQPLRVFCIHAPSGMGSYPKVVNSILDMLLDYRDGCDIIIGGDFNLSVSKRLATEERTTTTADLKIQARLESEFGLVNCWQTANPNTPLAQTLRWDRDRTVPYHCDGIFVPTKWRDRLRACYVVIGDKWKRLSDHNPVVAEFI